LERPKVYVRDSGLVHAQLRIGDQESLLSHSVVGASWEGAVLEHLVGILRTLSVPVSTAPPLVRRSTWCWSCRGKGRGPWISSAVWPRKWRGGSTGGPEQARSSVASMKRVDIQIGSCKRHESRMNVRLRRSRRREQVENHAFRRAIFRRIRLCVFCGHHTSDEQPALNHLAAGRTTPSSQACRNWNSNRFRSNRSRMSASACDEESCAR
jgi:hypothetical protein